MKKRGKYSLEFENVYLKEASIVGGKFEKEGPRSKFFDKLYDDNYCDTNSWEKAELKLIEDSFNILIEKSNILKKDIDLFIGGDLNNQIAITNYFMRQNDIPYLGIYSACSSCTESLIIGSSYIDNNEGFNNVICSVSSHNSTSERQFRYPTEYGGQKPSSTTFTSTVSGMGLLSKDKSKIKISKATIGVVVDGDIKDPQDMGRAMAPAAAITLLNHLKDFNLCIDDYDLILTGDLSYYGSIVFKEIIDRHGIYLKETYQDCGLLLYDRKKQNVYAGGSGCGCAAAIIYGMVKNLLEEGQIKNALIIATGALLNPIMIAQGETIPSIAHAVVLERCDK